MKQLRILTGRHAGARIRLIQAQYSIGSGPEAELQISDWKQEPATLEFDRENNVIQILGGGASRDGQAAARRMTLEDFHPVRFGDVALCAGPLDDAIWPGDMQILERMLKPRKPARPAATAAGGVGAGAGAGRFAIAGGVACTSLLAIFTYVASNSMTKAKAQAPTQPIEYRISTALSDAGVKSLKVRNAGSKVVVEGLVDGSSELQRVRETLQRFDGAGLLQKYASADDVSHAIGDALANSALRVRYSGSGVFVIEGDIADLGALRASVGHIAADLGGLVRRIDIAVAELPPVSRVHVDAMLVDSDVQYVQTRDGTKHLVIPRSQALADGREFPVQ